MDRIEIRRYAQFAERVFQKEREAKAAAARAEVRNQAKAAAKAEAEAKAIAEAAEKAAKVAQQVEIAMKSAKEAGPEAIMYLFLVVTFNVARKGITDYDNIWYYVYQSLSHEKVVSKRDMKILMTCANVRRVRTIAHNMSATVQRNQNLTPSEYYTKVLHLHSIEGLLKKK